MILTEEIIELAKSCGFDLFSGERDDESDGTYWECWEEQLITFAQRIYEMGYNTTNAPTKIHQMLIDAQMEHQVKVGELEHQIEKLKDEVDYWRGE